MKEQLTRIIVVLAVAAASVSATQATIVNPLVTSDTWTAGDLWNESLVYALGFQFTVTGGDRLVNVLGYPDLNNTTPGNPALAGDGLLNAQQVGLWTGTGTLLGSATVPAGTAGILDGVWRYASMGSSVTLTNGGTYRIGLDNANDGDRETLNTGSPVFAGGIGTIISVYNTSPGYPLQTGGADSAYGVPNAALLVPEPSTALLLGLGGVLLLRRVRQPRA